MSQSPPPSSIAVGQVSPDGQFRWDGTQWVPIPRGEREATPWTRPMQLAAAGLLTVDAVFTVATSFVTLNHDAILKQIQAQNNLPANTNVEQIVSISLFFAWLVVIGLAVIWLVAALGSYLRWRWIFWADLVLFAFAAIGALINLGNFAASRAQTPIWVVAVSEVLDIAGAAMFVWLLVGLIRYGPWAMRRPGA